MTSRSLPRLTLVLGGARSGKSSYAEQLFAQEKAPLYIATGQAFDDEMQARIAHHRDRRGPHWRTVEEPLDLAPALARFSAESWPILVDCLTFWLSNLMLAERDVGAACDELLQTLSALPGPVVLVSNEVGFGVVPDNALAREFRDHAGRLHQRLAAEADRVLLMVAGLPLILKGS